jgi:hypothetical protein
MDKSAETCGACHLNQYDDWKTSAHGDINVDCASCHNPHSQQIMTVGENKTACETCHFKRQNTIHPPLKRGSKRPPPKAVALEPLRLEGVLLL